MTEYRFLEPLDVLFLRGNQHFGDPGAFGESHMPPPPSVAAGALRSWLMVEKHLAPEQLQNPDTFTLTALNLARRASDGRIETVHLLPADIAVIERINAPRQPRNKELRIERLRPRTLAAGISSSAALPQFPILSLPSRDKVASGHLLTQDGWRRYLGAEKIEPTHLIRASELWQINIRVGVGLDAQKRAAVEGHLFTTQAITCLRKDERATGFLAGVKGTELPRQGIVRFGGDGRGAQVHRVRDFKPIQPDYTRISQDRRCRIILTTPGIFPTGWQLPGTQPDGHWHFAGISARLTAACVPRAQVISGWDLATQSPKSAQKAAPTGSVYWLEELQATPEQLRKLAETGLWLDSSENRTRQAEGFNRFIFARH